MWKGLHQNFFVKTGKIHWTSLNFMNVLLVRKVRYFKEKLTYSLWPSVLLYLTFSKFLKIRMFSSTNWRIFYLKRIIFDASLAENSWRRSTLELIKAVWVLRSSWYSMFPKPLNVILCYDTFFRTFIQLLHLGLWWRTHAGFTRSTRLLSIRLFQNGNWLPGAALTIRHIRMRFLIFHPTRKQWNNNKWLWKLTFVCVDMFVWR